MRLATTTTLLLLHLCLAVACAQQAEDAPPPTLVDFACTASSPFKAIPQLAELAGVDVDVQHAAVLGRPETLTCEFLQEPFWPAFLSLAQSAGLQVSEMGLRRLSVEANGAIWPGQPVSYWRGCGVMVAQSRRMYRVRYGQPLWKQNSFFLHMNLLADPALAVQRIYDPRISEAIDENGNSLLRTDGWQPADSRPDSEGKEHLVYAFDIPLSYPPGGGSRIARLKGELWVRAVAMEEIRIFSPLNAQGVTRSLSRFSVATGPLRRAEGGYELPVTFTPKPQPQRAGLQLTASAHREFLSGITLSDAKGRRYQAPEVSAGKSDLDFIVRFVDMQNVEAPQRLLWRIPTQPATLKIPFELRDIKVP